MGFPFVSFFSFFFLLNYILSKIWKNGGGNKMFWFFENYGNKYKKVGNCIRLTYVRDFVKC